MPLSGLRGVIFTFLLISFSKRYSPNCANATNEKKVLPHRQNDLKDWQKKLAVIIHRLPGLLTKPVDQPVKLLNHRGAKKKNGMKRKEILGRLYPFVKFLTGIQKMASLECKHKKKQQKHRIRGLLPRMFSSMNIPTCRTRSPPGKSTLWPFKQNTISQHSWLWDSIDVTLGSGDKKSL